MDGNYLAAKNISCLYLKGFILVKYFHIVTVSFYHYDTPKSYEGQLFYWWGSWGPQWASEKALLARTCCQVQLPAWAFWPVRLCYRSWARSWENCILWGPQQDFHQVGIYIQKVQGRRTGGMAWSLSLCLSPEQENTHSEALIRPQSAWSSQAAVGSRVDTCVLWMRARQSATTVTVLLTSLSKGPLGQPSPGDSWASPGPG